MRGLHSSLLRVALVALLFLALSGPAEAAPVAPAATAPIAGWFDWVPVGSGGVTRTTVVRIACLGMILALFIMYRNKH